MISFQKWKIDRLIKVFTAWLWNTNWIFFRNQRLSKNATIDSVFQASSEPNNDKPSQPYFELYKTDFDTFNALHTYLCLWGGSEGDTSVMLADRMFRLMDTNKDGFLNFQEVAKTFNLLCKGDHVLKLRLFYCLHLPGMVLPGIAIRVVDFSNGGYKFKQIFCLRININDELSKSAKIWLSQFFFHWRIPI